MDPGTSVDPCPACSSRIWEKTLPVKDLSSVSVWFPHYLTRKWWYSEWFQSQRDDFNIENNEINPFLRFSSLPNIPENYPKASQKHLSMSLEDAQEGLKFQAWILKVLGRKYINILFEKLLFKIKSNKTVRQCSSRRKRVVMSSVDALWWCLHINIFLLRVFTAFISH